MNTIRTTDVAIVGSGLLGLATALELAQRGLSVTVIGPRTGDHNGQATRAAGAMLTVFSEVETGHSADRIALEVGERVKARNLYEPWLDTIARLGGHAVDLRPGLWAIANGAGQDDEAELRAIADAAKTHGHTADFAHPREVLGLAPQLRAHAALHIPGEASVDPAQLTAALAAAVTAHPSCTWHDTIATGIDESGHHLVVTAADDTRTAAAHLVLAAGAASSALLSASTLADQAAAPRVLSGRGTSLLLEAPFSLPAAVRTVNRGFACGTHLVPRADGTLYLGATNRLSTRPDYGTRPSLDEIATLIHDGAAELNTQLRDARLVGARVGHRPVTIDHLPLWGATHHPTVHLATATYRCGILLAPRAAQVVADGVTDPTRAAHPYSPRRTMPVPDLAAMLAGTAQGLVDMLRQPGGQLPAGADRQLEHFLAAALPALANGPGDIAAILQRLWNDAPMPEMVPLLFDAAGRTR